MKRLIITVSSVLILQNVLAIAAAFASEPSHGLSYFGDLKYPRDFPYFDYANPDAPKGGRMKTSAIGTFNNLHPYADNGIPAQGIDGYSMWIYDRLMVQSQDELSSAYGNLAETVELADDYRSVTFTLREGAYWHDGMPITIEDVIWTFNTLKSKGSVAWKSANKRVVSVEQVGSRTFRFRFDETAPKTRQLAMQMSSFIPLPKHYWKNRTFNATTLVPPLGSGPYRIKTVDAGRIIYQRVKDYWGRNLNVNIGAHNLGEIEFIYFLDKNIVIQSLRAGVFDYKRELNTEDFATAYDFWGLHEGLFVKKMLKLGKTYGMDWGILVNTRIEKLSDIRVREALTLAYNFEWANRVLWHGLMKRNISYFIESGLEATGPPSDEELFLLEPFRGQVPERVFTHEFLLPENSPSGRNRDTLLQADALLESAGWVVSDFKRVNRASGKPFTLEIITSDIAQERMLIPYVENLKRLGILAKLRRIESNTMVNRKRTYDFEAVVQQIWLNNIPNAGWISSSFLSGNADIPNMQNYAGIKVPAVDALVEKLIFAASEDQMNIAGRALDRILLWSFYVVPGAYPQGRKFVYWDRFGFSPPEKMVWNGWPHLWWIDKEKNARVDAGISALKDSTN